MSISSISNTSYTSTYQQLSSGKRINSAADDAAGLQIAEKLESQSKSLDVGDRNTGTMQDMLNVADGALASITDSLQRMRELSVQASNGIYSDADRAAIQKEVDGLKQQISDVATQTQFNTKNILDGTNTSWNVAANQRGSSVRVNMPDATLAALGIDSYDVTGNFDISVIDQALEKVSSARGGIGASTNGLSHVRAYNSLSSYHTVSAKSRIEDLDFPKGVSELKKKQTLQEYQLMMQKKKMQIQAGQMRKLFVR